MMAEWWFAGVSVFVGIIVYVRTWHQMTPNTFRESQMLMAAAIMVGIIPIMTLLTNIFLALPICALAMFFLVPREFKHSEA